MIGSIRKSDKLTVLLSGEIDHHAASKIREEIDCLMQDQSIRHLILDFSNVSFMDSSGVGMLIGRYKAMKKRNGSMSSTGLSKDVERIYRISGLHRIIPFEELGGANER